MKPTVLLASRSAARLKEWVRATEDVFNIIGEVSTAGTCEAIVRTEHPSLLVMDLALEEGTAMDVLRGVGDERPQTIVISPTGAHPALLEACGLGATDVLTEPVTGERLRKVLELALQEKTR